MLGKKPNKSKNNYHKDLCNFVYFLIRLNLYWLLYNLFQIDGKKMTHIYSY